MQVCGFVCLPGRRRSTPVSGCSSRSQGQTDMWTTHSSTSQYSGSTAEGDALQISHWEHERWLLVSAAHALSDKNTTRSAKNSKYKPEKHPDGISNQKAVIQDPKQCLIVVLVFNEKTDKTVTFLRIGAYNFVRSWSISTAHTHETAAETWTC